MFARSSKKRVFLFAEYLCKNCNKRIKKLLICFFPPQFIKNHFFILKYIYKPQLGRFLLEYSLSLEPGIKMLMSAVITEQ